jgi:hypothetical protein
VQLTGRLAAQLLAIANPSTQTQLVNITLPENDFSGDGASSLDGAFSELLDDPLMVEDSPIGIDFNADGSLKEYARIEENVEGGGEGQGNMDGYGRVDRDEEMDVDNMLRQVREEHYGTTREAMGDGNIAQKRRRLNKETEQEELRVSCLFF